MASVDSIDITKKDKTPEVSLLEKTDELLITIPEPPSFEEDNPTIPLRIISNEELPRPTLIKTHNHPSRSSDNGTTASHTAIVLAKTQATAAREEAKELSKQVNLLKNELDIEVSSRSRLDENLEAYRTRSIHLDKELAIEKVRLEELRKSAELENQRRLRLMKRVRELEAENTNLEASLGWWSHRKLKQLRRNSE